LKLFSVEVISVSCLAGQVSIFAAKYNSIPLPGFQVVGDIMPFEGSKVFVSLYVQSKFFWAQNMRVIQWLRAWVAVQKWLKTLVYRTNFQSSHRKMQRQSKKERERG